MSTLKELLQQHAREFEDYLVKTKTLVIVLLDENLKIIAYNQCLSSLISSKEDVSGRLINTFLLPESQELLKNGNLTNDEPVVLNFKQRDSLPLPVQCYVFKISDGRYLILGEPFVFSDEEVLRKMSVMSNEMANMARELIRVNRELKEAHSKIKTLSGIVPICMHCKKIRDDKGFWNQLEKYITEHSDALLSHGICDACLKKYYPDLDL